MLKAHSESAYANDGRLAIVEFVTLFDIGGTERQVVNLARGLDPQRFAMHLVCFRHTGALSRELNHDTPIREYHIGHLYDPVTLLQQLRFARYLRRHRIRIVHTYGFYPNVFAIPAAYMASTPVKIASIRDLGHHLSPSKKRLQRVACRLADCIVVNAASIRDQLVADGYRAATVEVISNGIDIERFAIRRDGHALRDELGWEADKPIVALICRIEPIKWIEGFVQAAARVAKRFPEARFLIVGDDGEEPGAKASSYRADLERYASQLGLNGRLRFVGFRLDVPQILSTVSVAVSPSLSEGLSNSLLESQAAGVPVVASCVGGNPEAVQDGVTGLLVPTRDATELAGAICRLLGDPALAARMGAAGKLWVRQRFSLQRMVKQTEALYANLAGGKR